MGRAGQEDGSCREMSRAGGWVGLEDGIVNLNWIVVELQSYRYLYQNRNAIIGMKYSYS